MRYDVTVQASSSVVLISRYAFHGLYVGVAKPQNKDCNLAKALVVHFTTCSITVDSTLLLRFPFSAISVLWHCLHT